MANHHRLGQPFKIFCRADEEYCVSVRDDLVVLAPANPSDEYQHWYKDMRHGNEVNDEEGAPAMVLVNKATGQAIKHSHGRSHPVRLTPYDPEDEMDESVLWTESQDVGDGFRCIRMVNNIYLNLDALHGVEEHGSIRDGTVVGLWEWHEGDNQCWKILPWGTKACGARDSSSYSTGNLPAELASHRTVRIFCKADEEYSVTARDGTVCLAPSDPSDDYQHWVKDMRYSNEIQDEEGYPAFALVNKATGEAIKHCLGQSEPVRLVPYDAQQLEESVMWTESKDIGDGFRCIRMMNNIYLNFDALHGDEDSPSVTEP